MPSFPPSAPSSRSAVAGRTAGSLAPGPDATAAGRLVGRLATAQLAFPGWFLLVALATVLLAGLLASRLELRTSFGELLPQKKESVVVAERVARRIATASTLTVVATSKDHQALERFVDALAPELRRLGPDSVGVVDDGVRGTIEFFRQNAFLYAPVDDLRRARDTIVERYEYEVQKAAGLLLEEGDPPPPLTRQALLGSTDEPVAAERAAERYPDGYYLDPKENLVAVLVRTPVQGGDLERSNRLLADVQKAIDRLGPKTFAPDLETHFTGDLITSAEEYAQVKNDLAEVGVFGVALVLGVVYLFFLRARALLAMAFGIGIGVAWTFGLAELLIGHLNSSTGFLVSIVVGNGINCGIMYLARYLEARRESDVPTSLRLAHHETVLATLGAALAACTAYGSLVITDLRGFKHFGIIGGTGMFLCWLATYLFVPPLLVLLERWAPLTRPTETDVARSRGVRRVVARLRVVAEVLRGAYGKPFARVALGWPRLVAGIGAAAGVVALVLGARYLAADPMEYDMSKTRNEPRLVETSARQLARKVDVVVGRQGQDGLAIAVDRIEQVLPLKKVLEERRDAAPAGRKPFDGVVTIFDLLPHDQEVKLALAAEIRPLLEKARRRGFVPQEVAAEAIAFLPPPGRAPIGIDDLPEQVARSFTEKDGSRGRLVYIVPATGRSVWDAHYLLEWADSFRSTTLPDGSVVQGSGRSVIFADLILTVMSDMPRAVVASLVTTLLIVALTFRALRPAAWVVGTLLLGLAFTVATLALWGSSLRWAGGPQLELVGMRLNFLNFVALPITVGVGADYAVNVVQRYRLAGAAELRNVVEETGGALVLCSLTTTFGYLALTRSVNKAIQSFGIASAAGEISCVLAALLVLPAFLAWRHRRRSGPAVPVGDAAAAAAPEGGAATPDDGDPARG